MRVTWPVTAVPKMTCFLGSLAALCAAFVVVLVEAVEDRVLGTGDGR